jgi:DNA polymerase I-like protein with 3'-5' exonuclease and polymerase domains
MIYLDLETMASGGPDGNSPDAEWSTNKILLVGYKTDTCDDVYIDEGLQFLEQSMYEEIEETGSVDLCAHNAKFDIKYLMRELPVFPWHNVTVWDTMTFEYLESGHRESFCTLERAAELNGVTFSKSLNLGALLAAGTKMEDIPREELEPYLIEDVEVLAKIQLAQQARCCHHKMDHILPLAEMELNGLPFDVHGAEAVATMLQWEIDEAQENIVEWILQECEWQDGSALSRDDFTEMVYPKSKCIKPLANRTLSHLLTGHPADVKITPKWRFKLKGSPILDPAGVARLYGSMKPTHIGYPLDESWIDKINLHLGKSFTLLDFVLQHRKAYKVVNTYLLPMLRQARINGTVHPKLNTSITSTGRLSSSQPNGQNMPPEVRKLITATSADKVLEEIDYSQLETVCAAALSWDTNLIDDLKHGVDIHYNTAAQVFGQDNAKEKRKLAKNVNFGILYGGKARGLSLTTGVDETTIKKLIDAFFDSYPGVRTWQKEFFEDVVDNMVPHDVRTGVQRYRSDYVLPISGRKFRFIETQAPDWIQRKTGRPFSFSPNHTANYPIQGFAGGDLVMEGLVWLWRQVRSCYDWDDVKFRLTVHDSMLLERYNYINLASEYEDMCWHIQRTFKLPVEIKVDVDSGFNWS